MNDPHALPYRWSLLAALPIALCMGIMGLPDLFSTNATLFRALYTSLFLAWVFPLCLIQRRLRRSGMPWWHLSLMLLALTYLMSVCNCWIGLNLALHLKIVPQIHWRMLFSGLDGCWLALIAYCAVHALMINQRELTREQLRAATASMQAREAQLRALRYQLNPHFLFNTLNAVSSLVAEQRNRDAVRMIGELGEFLRSTLDGEASHEHSVADELALTESYLNIEKARLGARLQLTINVGSGVLHAMLPTLLLQPLLENAIRHGIAPLSGGGAVNLDIGQDGGTLHVTLVNDMPAVPADAKPSQGLGIRNVSERLQNLYGKEHRLQYRQRQDGRYALEIAIPFCTQGRQQGLLVRAA